MGPSTSNKIPEGKGKRPLSPRHLSAEEALAKRYRMDDDNDQTFPSESQVLHEADEEDPRFLGSGLTEQQLDIMDFVDKGLDQSALPSTLDPNAVKKMTLSFEKKVSKNQEMRIKYPKEPTKFITSEADLDDELKRLTALSEAPELYPVFVELGSLDTLLGLLAHENTDIIIAVLSTINEWVDEDLVADTQQGKAASEGMQLLVQALVRLFPIEFYWASLDHLLITPNIN